MIRAMHASPPFPLLCLCVAGAALLPVGAMSLDEAEAALGNEDFKVREQAEQVFRNAGMDEYDRIERLTHNDDPEVAARARTCLPVVLLGVDDQFPPELAGKLRHIDQFHSPELDEVVGELKQLDPPRPVTLIGLHSHWLTVLRPAGADALLNLIVSLEQALTAALRDNAVLTELRQLHPERYQAQTLAMVLNGLCRNRPEDLTELLPLQKDWTLSRPQITELLSADGYRLEVARAASMASDRLDAMEKVFNFAKSHKLTKVQQKAVQFAIDAEFRRDGILGDMSRLDIRRYDTDTLALILNGLCRQYPDDLKPMLALYQDWSRSLPEITQSLNAEGYRLEVARQVQDEPDRLTALGKLIDIATQTKLSNPQQAALRRQIGTYQDVACGFPVKTLDQPTGWFFFTVFGPEQLDLYREYRARFPEIPEATLLTQPLEALLVLEKEGAGAALNHVMKPKSVYGNVTVLGEWLHEHPELIKEPLPLPDLDINTFYNDRLIKFFRILIPYADDAGMKKDPKIAAAFEILTKDPRWLDVAKQARAAMEQQQQQAAGRHVH